jgi:NAD(P)-dependent dehydrogenase (short-subunit alcohol dehydrogenase family)
MRVALVTGGSSGIGAAVAIALAEDGWGVMAAGRDEGRLGEVAEVSEDIATWAGELAASEDCDELVAETIDEFGRLDCLVNSAGLLTRGDATETDDEDWRATMAINLDAPFFLSRAAIPHLASTRGSIVNIACNEGLRAGTRTVAYATSKAGLIMLTRTMARDHARAGIRVNAICPGAVDTPMLADDASRAEEDIDDFLEAIAADSPNQRIATPEDVASLVLFLASDDSRHITGSIIPIDGGLCA